MIKLAVVLRISVLFSIEKVAEELFNFFLFRLWELNAARGGGGGAAWKLEKGFSAPDSFFFSFVVHPLVGREGRREVEEGLEFAQWTLLFQQLTPKKAVPFQRNKKNCRKGKRPSLVLSDFKGQICREGRGRRGGGAEREKTL